MHYQSKGPCPNHVALDALRKGHVAWEKLHPNVRNRLTRRGYTRDSFRGPEQAEEYDHVFDD